MRNIRKIVIFLSAVFMWAISLNSAYAVAPEIYDIRIMKMTGRPGHEGLFPIQSQPTIGSNALVQARLNGFADKVNLVLRTPDGQLLSKTEMFAPSVDKVVAGTYFANIIVPTVSFTMSISGEDEEGNEFEGLPEQPSANTPQVFDVKIIPTIFEISPGYPLNFSVRVTNYGAPDTFNISLSSDIGGVVEPVSKNVLLNTDHSADVQFLYTAPKKINTEVAFIILTATASSAAPDGGTNQATLKLPMSMQLPGKLTAWLNAGEQGILKRNRKAALLVWLCDDNVDGTSILLANSVSPSSIQVIQENSSSSSSSGKNKSCDTNSRFKLKFDPMLLIDALRQSTGATSESRLMNIPISAYSKDGTPMFGYIPVVLNIQD